MTPKKVYNYIFKSNDSRKFIIFNGICFIIGMNLLTFFVVYKNKKYAKHNLDTIVKISENNDFQQY